jgi:hypothetical protein
MCVRSEFYSDPLFWVVIGVMLIILVIVFQCICLQRRKKKKSKVLMSKYAEAESKAQQTLKKHADDMLRHESFGQLAGLDVCCVCCCVGVFFIVIVFYDLQGSTFVGYLLCLLCSGFLCCYCVL